MIRMFSRLAIAGFPLALCFAFLPVLAADTAPAPSPNWNVEQGLELPIGKTPWEEANEHLFPYPDQIDEAPPAPVVQPAEWEPMTGVLIRYPLGLPLGLVAEMSEDVEVKTIVSSTSQMNTAYNQYAAGGVNMANCSWLIAPSNSMWTRDYGPWYIFTGEDVQGITDHNYNRPTRPQDNLIPWVLGDTLNIPVYGMPLTHTGGNYMTDGMGVGMSTELVYDENPTLTQAQVNDTMHAYTGIDDYVVMPDILTYGIHHIDCWAKMIDPGRIVVKRLSPPNTQLEANVAYFQSLISSYGRPYEVIRVDCQSSTPYTNALILNNKVLVPLFNNSLDAAAMQTWQNAMPGYEVLGYTGSWVSDDAIHCRAMGMDDRFMLRIVHVPLFDQVNDPEGYLVGARIHAYTNMPFVTGTPEVLWKTSGGAYTSLAMNHVSGDSFNVYIPPQSDNTTLYYYIHAADDSGRSEYHPYIGPGDPHEFHVLPAGAFQVTLEPVDPPIIIPANGGSFSFNVAVTNSASVPASATAWIMATLPNGSSYGPTLGPLGLNLPAGGSIARLRSQSVPGSAPAGVYTYTAYLGAYGGAIIDSSYFNFTKSSVGNGGALVQEFANSGEQFYDNAGTTLLPASLVLGQNYPNPFNPLTTIGFTLPQGSRVSLTICDLQGRTVATLVDGWRTEGSHEVTFDGSGLASGMYFYNLRSGSFAASGKMVLMK